MSTFYRYIDRRREVRLGLFVENNINFVFNLRVYSNIFPQLKYSLSTSYPLQTRCRYMPTIFTISRCTYDALSDTVVIGRLRRPLDRCDHDTKTQRVATRMVVLLQNEE